MVAKEETALIQHDTDKTSEVIRKEFLKKKIECWNKLQTCVEMLIDSSSASSKTGVAAPGIRQLLEKKEGLFRKNM